MTKKLARIIPSLVLAAAVLTAGAAQSDDLSHFRTADGLLVYYGVVPVGLLQTFPEGSPEALAHRRIPRDGRVHHLVVAVFDNDSMTRITDAKVTARVREPGLGWTTLSLPPTSLNDAVTYCGYFTFIDRRDYTIEIDVQRPGTPEIVTAGFRYSNG